MLRLELLGPEHPAGQPDIKTSRFFHGLAFNLLRGFCPPDA